MYCTEKGGGSFVVSGGDGSVMFEFFEEVLDQVPRLVECLVIISRIFAIGLWRNDGLNLSRLQPVDDARVSIVALISQQDVSFDFVEQNIRAVQITGLPGCQMKPGRVAQSIVKCVDFGAQSAL